MSRKKAWCFKALLIAVFLITGTVCFCLGRSAVSLDYKAEQDLNIRLNRSELEGLGEIEGPIYVTGHKSPDSDSVCCAIAYAGLLQKVGYDARPVVLGDISRETKYILDAANVDVPERLDNVSGRNIVLVDHSEYSQSADGLRDANVVSIIDHHGDGSVMTGNQLIYDARPLGSTATIIWIRYRNYGVEPDRQTALIMMGAIISDTNNLQSGTTTNADREALAALGKTAGISDTDTFANEICRESISHEGMTDEEIFFSDYKEYEAGDYQFSIGCISEYDEEGAAEMEERMRKLLPSTLSSTGMDMAFAQISIFHDDLDITYIVPSDDAASRVIERAFGDQLTFNGTSFVFKPGISRKKVLVPAITDVLKSSRIN